MKNHPPNIATTTTFRDLDRLYTIMDNLGLSRTIVGPVLDAFTWDMNNMYELSLGDSQSFGIMIMGKGENYFNRLAGFMMQAGMLNAEINRFLKYAKQFGYRSAFFKIDIDKTGVKEVTYYYRKKIPMTDVFHWLADDGIANSEIQKVAIITRFFDKEYAQLGVSLVPGKKGSEKIYYTLPGHISSWYKIAAAVKTTVKMPDKEIINLGQHYFTNYNRRIFFAAAFDQQKLVPVIQIMLFSIERKVAGIFFEKQGFDQGVINNIDYTLETSCKPNIDYLGFRLGGTKIQSLKTYFFKEYVRL